jgi:hypothetical protein
LAYWVGLPGDGDECRAVMDEHLLVVARDSALDRRIEQFSLGPPGCVDRTFTKSMHVLDPDGNEVELYVVASAARLEPTGKGLLEPQRQPDPHSLRGSS